MKTLMALLIVLLVPLSVGAQTITVYPTDAGSHIFLLPDVTGGPWSTVPATKLTLMPQMITKPSRATPSVAGVEVRAVHSNLWVAFYLTWKDGSLDQKKEQGVFPDGAAVGFPLKDPASTAPFMGNVGSPVEIWYWNAARQYVVEHGAPSVRDINPNAYQGLQWDPGVFWQPAIELGNPANTLLYGSPVQQNAAEGFGTLTTQETQNAFGKGVYRESDGTWHLVVVRMLNTGDPQDVTFSAVNQTGMIVAVWDGTSGDRGGRKNVIMRWVPLVWKE